MIDKYAEYNKRLRTYIACRGILRIKQADAMTDEAMKELGGGGSSGSGRTAAEIGVAHGDAMASGGKSVGDALARAGAAVGSRIAGDGGGGIEGASGNLGAWIGSGIRSGVDAASRGISSGAKATGDFFKAAPAYLEGAGKGLYKGVGSALQGARQGMSAVGTGIYNGLNNWRSDFANNPGSHLIGAATAAGTGYLGSRFGNWLADKMKLSDKSGWRTALKWGLGGLSGLAGYAAGTGLSKGLYRGYTNPSGGGGASTSGTTTSADTTPVKTSGYRFPRRRRYYY